MENTYWIKYSDYEIIKDERNMDVIRPVKNAVPMAYDVAAALGKNVAETISIALDDSDITARSLKFVRRFGLLGMALEEDNYMTLPDVKADMNMTVFAATGRKGDKYAGVFSPEYGEKSANISAWLDWISVQYNRTINMRNGRFAEEPFAALTLQTMLESACRRMLSDGTVKPCPACKKIFYNADHEVETCSEACDIVYKNMKHLQWMKENFHGKPIAGG